MNISLNTRRQLDQQPLAGLCNVSIRIAINALIFFAIAPTANAQEEGRTWVSGTYRVAARLMAVEGDSVVLRKDDNGKTIRVKIEILSEEDQQYINDYIAANAEPPTQPVPGDSSPVVENSQPVVPPVIDTTPEPVTPTIPEPASGTTAETNSPPGTGTPGTSTPAGTAPPTTGGNAGITGAFEPMTVPEVNISRAELLALPSPLKQTAQSLLGPLGAEEGIATMVLLKEQWIESYRPTLISVLRKSLVSEEKFVRARALEMLGELDLDNSFEYVLPLVDDNSYEVRVIAFQLLETILDQRAINPLVARFPGRDRSTIGRILTAFGSPAEGPLLPHLNHELSAVRTEVGFILKNIGTAASIPMINKRLETEENQIVILQLKRAIADINKRTVTADGQR